MKGLSFRSMVINLFFQTVIFLYLLDNETSWMILFSSGTGLAIEVWKLRKAVKKVELRREHPERIPRLVIVPADSYELSETKAYDEEAMRSLSLTMYPLVVGYSAFSLIYGTHKSWYSWVLTNLVNFVCESPCHRGTDRPLPLPPPFPAARVRGRIRVTFAFDVALVACAAQLVRSGSS
jgi:hypothetical protein